MEDILVQLILSGADFRVGPIDPLNPRCGAEAVIEWREDRLKASGDDAAEASRTVLKMWGLHKAQGPDFIGVDFHGLADSDKVFYVIEVLTRQGVTKGVYEPCNHFEHKRGLRLSPGQTAAVEAILVAEIG